MPKIATVSADQAFASFKHGALLRGVYQKESSGGREDSCKDKGRVNGFGFMESSFTWQCFDSFSEVASRVDQWFEDNLKDKTVIQALCYYNTGKRLNDCGYAHDVIAYSK